MRFRSELLQSPKYDSEAFITKIYDVYRSPDGHIARDDDATSEEDSGSEAESLWVGRKAPK